MGTSISRFFHAFEAYLFKPVHPASLGLFRILFGLTMFVQTAYFIATDFVKLHISQPIIHFPYHFFQFVVPLPSPFMDVLMWVMLVASLLIAVGVLYRYAIGLFLLSFTYLWLIDKGFFNNHYYLITLLCILLLFVKGDAWAALPISSNKQSTTYIPNWQIFILKAQIFIVFFVAGINKLNPYWLIHFQPMDYILNAKADISGLEFLRSAAMAAFFSYGGFIVDISVGFLLWWKRTRMIGILIFIGFNFLNFWLFWNIGEIGIFPLLLLSTIVLFIEPDTPVRWLGRQSVASGLQSVVSSTVYRLPSTVITVYLIFHLLFPFRHLLYPGHVDWTGEGQRFAWRMKTILKEADIQFFIKDNNGNKYPVPVNKMLSPKQYNNLTYYPDLIPPIAQAMQKQALREGITAPQVVADFNVKFMGVHPARPIVSPDTDLSRVRYQPFLHSTWINSNE